MTWVETHVRTPRTERPLFLKFRNGLESKQAYPTDRQRWTHEGNDFDIVAYAVPEERAAV